MAPSDPNNSSSRGATRSALIIVGVLALLGLAYAIARVDILRARIVNQDIDMRALQENNSVLRTQIAALTASAQNSSKQVAQLQTELSSLSTNFGELSTQAEQAQRLTVRSEALYLLRLANDQLHLAHDLSSAIDTLSAAETLLRNTTDTALNAALNQVQAALQQLRALPSSDTTQIQQQLTALEPQIGKLQLSGIKIEQGIVATAEVLPEAGLARAWALLKRGVRNLFTIRKTGAEASAILTADEQSLRRRHLQLLLLTARLAAHVHDQAGYATTLQDAIDWLNQAFDGTDPAVLAMRTQLQQLAKQNIAPATPGLAPIIQALTRYVPAASSSASVTP